jgi:hypothetical protein
MLSACQSSPQLSFFDSLSKDTKSPSSKTVIEDSTVIVVSSIDFTRVTAIIILHLLALRISWDRALRFCLSSRIADQRQLLDQINVAT